MMLHSDAVLDKAQELKAHGYPVRPGDGGARRVADLGQAGRQGHR